MDDYVVSALAFAAAARLALHRGDLDETNRQLTRAMRTRPTCTYVMPWLAVRVRLQLAKMYLALSDATTAHHLMREIDDILLRRPNLGTLTEDVRSIPSVAIIQRTHGGQRRTAAQPRGAQGPAVPPDASHVAGDRRSSVRFAQHRSVAGRIDLSQVRCLIAKRGGAARHRCRPAGRLSVGRPEALARQRLVDVMPQRDRDLRCRGHDARKADDGRHTAARTSTISSAVAPASTAPSVSAPKDGWAPRIATRAASRTSVSVFGSSVDPASTPEAAHQVFRQVGVVDREAAQPFEVVHVLRLSCPPSNRPRRTRTGHIPVDPPLDLEPRINVPSAPCGHVIHFA